MGGVVIDYSAGYIKRTDIILSHEQVLILLPMWILDQVGILNSCSRIIRPQCLSIV